MLSFPVHFPNVHKYNKKDKKKEDDSHHLLNWLRERDLNPRPPGYEPDELPDCSIPRYFLSRLRYLSTAPEVYIPEHLLSIHFQRKRKKIKLFFFVRGIVFRIIHLGSSRDSSHHYKNYSSQNKVRQKQSYNISNLGTISVGTGRLLNTT